MSYEENGIEIKPVPNLPTALAGTVFVRTLAGDEFDNWQERIADEKKTMARFAAFAEACACTAEGELRFKAGEAIKLSTRVLKTIFTAGMEVNALNSGAGEALKKD